jgi:Contractile injection system tube protein
MSLNISILPFPVSIGSLDDKGLTVTAQYNPKELEVNRAVPWTKHTNKSNESGLQLEFSGADGRGMSLELFFDGSEGDPTKVSLEIEKLEKLCRVRVPGSTKDEEKRPHHCVVVFGTIYATDVFRCVIESMSTKYTMFNPLGVPIRATVNLKLKEADSVMMKPGEAAAPAAAAKK